MTPTTRYPTHSHLARRAAIRLGVALLALDVGLEELAVGALGAGPVGDAVATDWSLALYNQWK